MRHRLRWWMSVWLSLPMLAVALPADIEVDGSTLERVAVAEYRLLWKPITRAALYVEPASRPSREAILDPHYDKALMIEYHVSVSAERFRQMTRSALAEAWPVETLERVATDIDQFCEWLDAVDAGDHYRISWTAHAGLALARGDVVIGRLGDPEAAAVILSLWLGRAAVSEAQRDELLEPLSRHNKAVMRM